MKYFSIHYMFTTIFLSGQGKILNLDFVQVQSLSIEFIYFPQAVQGSHLEPPFLSTLPSDARRHDVPLGRDIPGIFLSNL